MTKWVYNFGGAKTEGRRDMKELLGGKGANLAEMASIGLPVPPGFTVTTEVCTYFYQNEKEYPDALKAQIAEAVAQLEKDMDAKFGDPANPLLLSVRSGARVSMPGMMDTVLNLGLNDVTVDGLAKKSGDERFAWDSYRRFIQMYGDVVLGVPHHDFEDILEQHKRDEGVTLDTDITAQGWKEIVAAYKKVVVDDTGKPFPIDPQEQLWGAVGAVFNSWEVPRAIAYRAIHDIPGDWGTAVNVQAMVFGNMGQDCATGVAFTRDPSTGENYFYGEYLVNAQGEDVVAGIRTPQSLTKQGQEKEGSDLPSMEETMPVVFKQLDDIRHKLEKHYRDMQDIEFTVQRGINREEALLRIEPQALDQLLHPTLDPMAHKQVVAKGLPASPGAASGTVVFTAEEAEKQAADGKKVMLCRRETSPEDIHGMHVAVGIVTSRGGMTSHAAVVARGMGRPCVAGAGALHIDYDKKIIRVDDTEVKAGDVLTIDGSTGEIMLGAVETVQAELSGDFSTVMGWADTVRRMKVRANAETPGDAQTARHFGAEGIGLCRTEHMFFDAARIQAVREMILATSAPYRRDVLERLLPEQRGDFVKLFEIMKGLPVTVRLLDPPLHEFLPQSDDDIKSFSKTAGVDEEKLRRRLSDLHEANPMLGHRGCRLGVTFPEIYEMQVRAILEAAIEIGGVTPEIMIPLVATRKEFTIMKKMVDEVAAEVFKDKGKKVDYMVGTMIELPRAALTADEIADGDEGAEFFSFGTNDLTQTTLGLSRDDSANFMNEYTHQGIFEKDPFVTLDQSGVGQLVQIAADKGRHVRPGIKLGICGEHGGDPASITFCESVGLDYVSCSPYRVPIARLAAAQAAVRYASKSNGATQIKRKAA